MKLRSSFTQVPYLERKIVDDNSNLIIKSEDGHEVKFNHYFLISWSTISKRVLRNFPLVDNEVVISSNLSLTELRVFHDFIMKGSLPTSDVDIMNDKLPNHIESIFLSFGINLKKIVKNFLYGIVENEIEQQDDFQCKLESDDGNYDVNPEVVIKTECDGDDYIDENSAYEENDHLMKSESTNLRGPCPECYKIIHKNSMTRHLRNVHYKNDEEIKHMHTKFKFHQRNVDFKKVYKYKKVKNDVNDDFYEEDLEKIEPLPIIPVPPKSSDKPKFSIAALIAMAIQNSSPARTEAPLKDIYIWIEETFPYFSSLKAGKDFKFEWKRRIRDCLSRNTAFERIDAKHNQKDGNRDGGIWRLHPRHFNRLFRKIMDSSLDNPKDLNQEPVYKLKELVSEGLTDSEEETKNDSNSLALHYSTIRGLRTKSDKFGTDHYKFMTHKNLLLLQKRLKNKFKIQIPPEDFTEEDFKEFTFQKPIEEYEVDPEHLAKFIEVCPKPGTTICGVCNQSGLNTSVAMEEHHIKIHSIHYKCPFEGCKYAIQKFYANGKPVSLYRFARHLYFHDHAFPQFSYPHECIACGMTTPFTCTVKYHLNHQGPYHDNQCPRCPNRFATRADLLQHVELEKHEGFRCGFCQEVFETMADKNDHRKQIHLSKPKSDENPIPEKKVDNTDHLCVECGKVFAHKAGLWMHKKTVHDPAEEWPCEYCGKVFPTRDDFSLHQDVKIIFLLFISKAFTKFSFKSNHVK